MRCRLCSELCWGNTVDGLLLGKAVARSIGCLFASSNVASTRCRRSVHLSGVHFRVLLQWTDCHYLTFHRERPLRLLSQQFCELLATNDGAMRLAMSSSRKLEKNT